MKIFADRARTLVYEQYDTEDELTVEHQEQTGSNRWSSIHQLVVTDRQGRFWETSYSQGLTEYQDEQAFDDMAEVEFHEVCKVPQTTYRYEKM